MRVRGLTIEARVWEGGAPPLVLLHEGLGSVSLWRDFPERLAQQTGRGVFAYSRAGHGASDPPATPHTTNFMHDEAREWLPAVLDASKIDEAILVGHSDGASIALIFAATYPERVRSLVLEAPHVFVEDISIASIERMRTLYETTDLRGKLARHHANVDVMFRGWNDVWLDPAFRDWNLQAYLPQITCPVLLVQGEQDEYGTVHQIYSIEAAVAGPRSTLRLPDCGHSPHRDQPQKVLAAIEQFIGAPDCHRFE